MLYNFRILKFIVTSIIKKYHDQLTKENERITTYIMCRRGMETELRSENSSERNNRQNQK